jgi:hypothetical protein
VTYFYQVSIPEKENATSHEINIVQDVKNKLFEENK